MPQCSQCPSSPPHPSTQTQALLAQGKAQSHLYPAYTAFFIVGTLGALQVPVIGWAPLRSMEQLMPLVVFGLVQLQELRKALGSDTIPKILAACAVAAGLALLFSGYFGAFSQRVAALFGVRCLPTQTFNFFLFSLFCFCF